ncbi:hypothetical protein RND81_05G069200 [Saponaria officinalis]|uniref:C2H2-type domain-containing protein n=1 Tax=Saponaria officinalis TaxID=3572 RepID=A0AAW1KW77_SAPOF
MEMETYHHETLENSDSIKVNEVDNNSTTIISQIDDEDNTGIGRTYECSYCKRGFTNAQALGGHMNIHRKDKAKAKHDQQQQHQQNYYYSNNSTPTISYNNHNIINEGLSSYTNYNHPSNYNSAPQMGIYGANYNYYQSYNNYSFVNTPQQTIYGTNDFPSEKTHLFELHEDRHHHHHRRRRHHLDADLSLRANNSSSMVDYLHQSEENKNNEDKYGAIDLELRLGYDP